jgi:hypothetical protein
MRSRRPAVLVIAMLLYAMLIAGCGSRRSSPQEPAPTVAASPVPSSRIDGFDLINTHRFPTTEAGVQYRYEDSSDLQADVYIYEGHAARYGADVMAALRAEVGDFREGLPLGVRRGYYGAYSIVSDTLLTVRVAEHDYTLHRITLAVTRGGQSHDSYFYIAMVGREYVKVRITQPTGKFPLTRADAFVHAVLEDVARKT